jgi:hypothetical protein
VSFTEKSMRDLDERGEKWRRLRPQTEALLAGDTDRLARLTAEQADTLLYMLAYHEAIPGVRLDEELGVPRAAVDVLIDKATNLDLPLTQAAFFNRVEYVRLLLSAGGCRAAHHAYRPALPRHRAHAGPAPPAFGSAGARVPNGRSPSIDRTTGAGPPRAATCNKWRGAHRWMIERTIALLHWFRRLRIRWEIRDDIHEAFMTLAAVIICWRHLTR